MGATGLADCARGRSGHPRDVAGRLSLLALLGGALLRFAVGAGAILQVIVEVGRLLVDRAGADATVTTSWVTLGGVTAGLAIMYATALLV